MIQKIILSLCFIFFGRISCVFAQEISYSNFTAIEQNDHVFLKWVIDSGSTCFGIEIQRTIDEINYTKVGEIIGTCGSNSSSQSYSFFDESPVFNTTNSYRLLFGGSQYSISKQIFIRSIPDGEIFLYPNPASEQITMEFNNEKSDQFTIEIQDLNGKSIFSEPTKSDSYDYNCSALKAGTYWVVLRNETGIFARTRFLKTVKED